MTKTVVIACLLAALLGLTLGYHGPYVVSAWNRDHGYAPLDRPAVLQALPSVPGWYAAARLSGTSIPTSDAWNLARHRIAFWNAAAYLPLGLLLGLGVSLARRRASRSAGAPPWISRNSPRLMALAGNAVALFLAALIGSAFVCRALNRAHPLEGGITVALLFIGSPFIACFQIAALHRTKASGLGGAFRTLVFTGNVIGLLLALCLTALLIAFWCIGPLNPG